MHQNSIDSVKIIEFLKIKTLKKTNCKHIINQIKEKQPIIGIAKEAYLISTKKAVIESILKNKGILFKNTTFQFFEVYWFSINIIVLIIIFEISVKFLNLDLYLIKARLPFNNNIKCIFF